MANKTIASVITRDATGVIRKITPQKSKPLTQAEQVQRDAEDAAHAVKKKPLAVRMTAHFDALPAALKKQFRQVKVLVADALADNEKQEAKDHIADVTPPAGFEKQHAAMLAEFDGEI